MTPLSYRTVQFDFRDPRGRAQHVPACPPVGGVHDRVAGRPGVTVREEVLHIADGAVGDAFSTWGASRAEACRGGAEPSGGPGAQQCTTDTSGRHRKSRVSPAGLRVLPRRVRRRPHRVLAPLAVRPGEFPQARHVRSCASLLGTTIRLARRRGCPVCNTPPRAGRCEYALDPPRGSR